jgi:hypothetical protein
MGESFDETGEKRQRSLTSTTRAWLPCAFRYLVALTLGIAISYVYQTTSGPAPLGTMLVQESRSVLMRQSLAYASLSYKSQVKSLLKGDYSVPTPYAH